jgi:hypothetical protein
MTQAYCIEDFAECKSVAQVSRPSAQRAINRPVVLNTKKVKQPKGGHTSYFERGLVVGASLVLAALTGSGFLVYRGVRGYLLN